MTLLENLQNTLESEYAIQSELDPGGMSRVFVALDRNLNRRVVIKVLLPELAATVSASRFKREILMAAQLAHPHIVAVHSAGEMEGMPYFIMPFIEGESLGALLKRGERPSSEMIRPEVVDAILRHPNPFVE